MLPIKIAGTGSTYESDQTCSRLPRYHNGTGSQQILWSLLYAETLKRQENLSNGQKPTFRHFLVVASQKMQRGQDISGRITVASDSSEAQEISAEQQNCLRLSIGDFILMRNRVET